MDKKIWISSDLHFNHDKDFIYKPRGFDSIEKHDEGIIQNWNNCVSWTDEVWILGDLMLENNDSGIKKLNQLTAGNINIIGGNHDTDNRIKMYLNLSPRITYRGLAYRLKYKGYIFYLSHYPCLTSNLDKDKPLKKRVINLCGHSHCKDKFQDMDKGIIYHCELDCHNNKPILLDNIIEDIKNYLG